MTGCPLPPLVVLLVEASSSMFDGEAGTWPWTLLEEALMDPVDGVLAGFESQLRLGITTFGGARHLPRKTIHSARN